MADNHANHHRESLKLQEERQRAAIPGSPWDREDGPEPSPEYLAAVGLWADSGGMHED